jgi:hypothetical protein
MLARRPILQTASRMTLAHDRSALRPFVTDS